MNTRIRELVAALTLSLVLSVAAGAASLQELSKELTDLVSGVSSSVVELRAARSPGDAKVPLSVMDSALAKAAPNPALRLAVTRPQSVGSGFVIDAAGYVLTTKSVVAGAKDIKVVFSDGSEADGEVVGTDDVSGVAVVNVDKSGLKALRLGDSDDLAPGALVVTVNNQAGMRNTASLGMVAGVGRDVTRDDMIQISGTVGPGASGGPVFDGSGKVVGVTSAMLSPSPTALPFNLPEVIVPMLQEQGKDILKYRVPPARGKDQDVPWYESAPEWPSALDFSDHIDRARSLSRTSGSSGFAIPINRIKPILEELKSGRKIDRAWLGAAVDQKEDKIVFGEVFSGSPAQEAGLKPGDELVSADGRKFTEVRDFVKWISERKSGDKLNLTVRRGDKNVQVKAILGAWPDSAAKPGAARKTPGPILTTRMPFSLSLDDAGIAEVAKALSNASGQSVVVTEPEKIMKKISVHLKSVTIDKALDVICRNMGCRYEKDGDSYVISPK